MRVLVCACVSRPAVMQCREEGPDSIATSKQAVASYPVRTLVRPPAPHSSRTEVGVYPGSMGACIESVDLLITWFDSTPPAPSLSSHLPALDARPTPVGKPRCIATISLDQHQPSPLRRRIAQVAKRRIDTKSSASYSRCLALRPAIPPEAVGTHTHTHSYTHRGTHRHKL